MRRGELSEEVRNKAKAAFIEALRKTGVVTYAARAADIDRCLPYVWRRLDEAFAAQFADALEEAADALEFEARRRALEGYDEYVTCKDGLVQDREGNPVLQRRYSDALMQFLLRGQRPEKYRDRSTVDMTVKRSVADMTDEDLLQIAQRNGPDKSSTGS